MTDALYVKTPSGVVPINLAASGGGGGGGKVTVTRVRQVLPAVLKAGTAFDVPEHTVGSTNLLVCYNGALCVAGADEQYVDVSSTSIRFNDDLPAFAEIDCIYYEGGLDELSQSLS